MVVWKNRAVPIENPIDFPHVTAKKHVLRNCWLQVRRRSGGEWMNLKQFDDEADALMAMAEKKQTSTQEWEFRVA